MLKSYTMASLALILSLTYTQMLYSQSKPQSTLSLSLSRQKSESSVQVRELKFDQTQWQNYLRDLKNKNGIRSLENNRNDGQVLRVQGPGTSGGGNNYETEFHYLSKQVLKEILDTHLEPSLLQVLDMSYSRLKNENALYFTHDKLFLNDKEKTAMNDYAAFVVLVNKKLWDQSTFSQKRQIIVHELLGLARSIDPKIDDSDYSITNQIFLKLQRQGQKVFLLNTDFPQAFRLPEHKSQRFEGNYLQYQLENEKGLCEPNTSKIIIDMKKIETSESSKIQVMFDIFCRMTNGQIYSHSEGQEGGNILDVTSQNILELNVDYGSFVVGWISGPDMLIRSPFQLLTIKKNADGQFVVRFEFYKVKNSIQNEYFDATVSTTDLQ